MRLKISITREILEKSKYCGTPSIRKATGHSCAVALAVKDIFPEAYVYNEFISLSDQRGEGIELPQDARLFINLFDSLICTPEKRLDLTPFSFEIEIPDSVISKIGLKELESILDKSDTLERV